MNDIDLSDIEVLWDKKLIAQEIKRVSKEIDNKFKNSDSVNLIPILTGGLMFVSSLIFELENLRSGCYKMFPIIAKSYGNSTQSQGTKIYGYEFLSDSLDKNSPSVIVDDIMDTGETLVTVSNKVKEISNSVIFTAVLLDKLGRRNNILEPDFSCFVLEDNKWIVGYGMDYEGKFRGLDFLGYIPKLV